MNSDELDAFLATPRDAVLSVALRSGRAIGTPIWFRWRDGVVAFQSPTTTAKTEAIRRLGRASVCVHEQVPPRVRAVTIEGPVAEVEFDLERDIVAAANHYLGDDAPTFIAGIEQALASGRRWASFELIPENVFPIDRNLW